MTELNWVVDIGVLLTVLKDVLTRYNYKNLNDIFPGVNTTTEFMCKKVGKISGCGELRSPHPRIHFVGRIVSADLQTLNTKP